MTFSNEGNSADVSDWTTLLGSGEFSTCDEKMLLFIPTCLLMIKRLRNHKHLALFLDAIRL